MVKLLVVKKKEVEKAHCFEYHYNVYKVKNNELDLLCNLSFMGDNNAGLEKEMFDRLLECKVITSKKHKLYTTQSMFDLKNNKILSLQSI